MSPGWWACGLARGKHGGAFETSTAATDSLVICDLDHPTVEALSVKHTARSVPNILQQPLLLYVVITRLVTSLELRYSATVMRRAMLACVA